MKSLGDILEETVIHVISYGYLYASIPFVLGILGAIVLD
jgi:hypothetical protein|tara:strand:+ start:174 stop:290 length:117 start_codon:yes stop_codon:yes gene_type:complete